MTEQQAERIANLVLGLAAAGAAYYVLKTPQLRRVVWQAARNAVAAAGPAWLASETRRAWTRSGSGTLSG